MPTPLIREFRLAKRGYDGANPFLSGDGAFLGDGTPLLEKDAGGRWRPLRPEGVAAGLAKSYGAPADPGWRMDSLATVARALNRGDLSLAAIALVQAEFPAIPQEDEWFAKGDHDVAGEARVPKGSGPTSGQWALSGGSGAAGAIAVGTSAGAVAAGGADAASVAGILAWANRAALVALEAAGATLTGAVTLAAGIILIPTPAGAVSDGTLPGHPEISYHFDEGHLTLTRANLDGTTQVLFDGRAGQDQLYRDANGNVIGRDLDASVALNGPAVVAMADARPKDWREARAQSLARTDDDPKVCPDPGPDTPHGAELPAILYQIQVSGLEPGEAIWVNGVSFDGCRQLDGTLLDAKGPGYLQMMEQNSPYPWLGVVAEFLKQAGRQVPAANGHNIEWHFAEEPVANYVRALFAEKYPQIKIIYDPPRFTVEYSKYILRMYRFKRMMSLLNKQRELP